MTSTDHPVYQGAITLFLQEHGPTTPGRLQYHLAGKLAIIEACLADMVERGQIEACGIETASKAYQGQPLYRLQKAPYADERALIERHLEGANEELLGLHRYGVLTYEQYTDVANLLVEAQEKLKRHLGRKQ
jgi:hypothetical protein